jgi:hypothetical protein
MAFPTPISQKAAVSVLLRVAGGTSADGIAVCVTRGVTGGALSGPMSAFEREVRVVVVEGLLDHVDDIGVAAAMLGMADAACLPNAGGLPTVKPRLLRDVLRDFFMAVETEARLCVRLECAMTARALPLHICMPSHDWARHYEQLEIDG